MSHVPDEAVRIDDEGTLSYMELVAASGVAEQVVREMVSYGVLTPHGGDTTTWTFTMRSLVVVRKAQKLQRDFELDTHAVTVVLRYLERIEALETQIQSLRAQRG
jgi:chaperone modulatory protein CbpM